MEATPLRMGGDEAKIMVGYHVAARLRSWQVVSHPVLGGQNTIMEAVVERCDRLWASMIPSEVGLWMGSAWWVWHRVMVLTPIEAGQPISIQLIGDPVAQGSL